MTDNEDPPTGLSGPTVRARNARSSNNNTPNSSDRTNNPPTYGYHNTFHTHDQPPPPVPPPSYACATSEATLRQLREKALAESRSCELPAYSCSIELEGILGLKNELSSPFQLAHNREWNDVYVFLRGTQLSIYRLKYPGPFSKNRNPGPGRLIKTFTLQHAEVGLAADFKRFGPIPKSPFAHLVPVSARPKLFETDPQLFEPIREYAIRLRVETEQILLCHQTQEGMLDWLESLTASVDISPPLEDRSEPRYRSLPRRSRRQRMLDGARVANLDNLSTVEGGRSIIAEQEQIIRRLYPHLAATNNEATEPQPANPTPHTADPETDELDPEDVRFPSMRRTGSSSGDSEERPSSSSTTESSDPKSRPVHTVSQSQALRYRRRCAPILLASSPRVSDVVMHEGKRMRINVKEHTLLPLTALPPRYDAHNFPKKCDLAVRINEPAATKPVPASLSIERPAAPARGLTDDSFMSFGYDLASTSSQQQISGDETDMIRSMAPSEPPSPTVLAHAKADPTRKVVVMGTKTRTSEDRTRDDGLNAVSLGMGLLI